ncbi:hypothetical protein G9A89_012338 [Geosiphon pyriformis]|nr:hypothetical protein G9A89_012338 [Geosiphon pyriformis]
MHIKTQNWRLAIIVYQPIPSSFNQPSGSHQWSLRTGYTQNLSSQNYLSLLVTPKDTPSNNLKTNQKLLTSNILPATVMEDESLAVIFPFEIEDSTSMPLFSGAALKEKPITAMYIDAKVNDHFIKLILDSGLADSIIIRQLMNQLGC